MDCAIFGHFACNTTWVNTRLLRDCRQMELNAEVMENTA